LQSIEKPPAILMLLSQVALAWAKSRTTTSEPMAPWIAIAGGTWESSRAGAITTPPKIDTAAAMYADRE
jgi:hypothetical protein